jgi:catechol 2,3-dioxygenase-like lactoylglutathione lyase family enzyme
LLFCNIVFIQTLIMAQRLAHIALVVNDYDEAIAFYTQKLGFTLVEDTFLPEENKRWVIVSPSDENSCQLLLAKAKNEEQVSRIGNQTGGRVFLFLHTQHFDEDYKRYKEVGIEFVRDKQIQPHGTVAVFKDLYGNLWDLIQPSK